MRFFKNNYLLRSIKSQDNDLVTKNSEASVPKSLQRLVSTTTTWIKLLHSIGGLYLGPTERLTPAERLRQMLCYTSMILGEGVCLIITTVLLPLFIYPKMQIQKIQMYRYVKI